MPKQLSFSKYEHHILPGYREKMNHTESTEDVKKFFHYTVKELFDEIFEGKIELDYNDVDLLPEDEPYYSFSKQLLRTSDFKDVWHDSDLPRIIGRLAEIAQQHYTHLSKKHPDKTESKIREKPSDIKKGKGRGGRFSTP